jgi:hypothetical protein
VPQTVTLEDLMTLTREADAAKAAMELSEKEIGQAQRRAVKKATAFEEAAKKLSEATAAYKATVAKKA